MSAVLTMQASIVTRGGGMHLGASPRCLLHTGGRRRTRPVLCRRARGCPRRVWWTSRPGGRCWVPIGSPSGTPRPCRAGPPRLAPRFGAVPGPPAQPSDSVPFPLLPTPRLLLLLPPRRRQSSSWSASSSLPSWRQRPRRRTRCAFSPGPLPHPPCKPTRLSLAGSRLLRQRARRRTRAAAGPLGSRSHSGPWTSCRCYGRAMAGARST